MNDTNIAWTRTTVNALWLGLLVWLNARFEWGIDFDSPWIILIVGVSAGVVWRGSELLTSVPYLGYLLFGINKPPHYTPLPAPPGDPVPPDRGFANNDVVWTIVGILAILALVLWIAGRI